jgi:hypothetical protein
LEKSHCSNAQKNTLFSPGAPYPESIDHVVDAMQPGEFPENLDNVESAGPIGAAPALEIGRCNPRHPRPLRSRHRGRGRAVQASPPRFHFNENDDLSIQRYQVDLAASHAEAALENRHAGPAESFLGSSFPGAAEALPRVPW